MKKHIVTLLLIVGASLAIAQTVDLMSQKVAGANKPVAKAATTTAIGAYALIDKLNNIVVNAYDNALKFEGATEDAYETTLAVTDPTADRTITLPNGSGTCALQAKTVLAPSATISFAPASSTSAYTLVPDQAATINAVTTGAIAGRDYFLVITTSGTSSFTLTFGTAFKTTGTLATGTVSAKVFVMHFIFDGTNYNEVSRTAAM